MNTAINHDRPIDTMTTDEMRAEFRILRRNAQTEVTAEEWMDAVRALLPRKGATHRPATWLLAARKARVTCPKCHGTGLVSWGGTVNGKPVHTGVCFRCQGAKTQGQADFRRNYGHNNYSIRRAFAEMIG